jgi:hypothetical protein
LNRAVTLRACVRETVQVFCAPLHAPVHPANDEPCAGAAVRVTHVPHSNDAEQFDPQLIPAGDDVTVPRP